MKLFSKIHIFALALIASAASLIGAGQTLCGDLSTYTYNVPIDSNVKVYFSDNEIFIPTASGEFKVYLDRYANWGFSYFDDIHNVLPSFMFDEGIRPVSIEFGMDIDVSWDSGFASGTNINLDPSFKFTQNTTNVRVNSQYPGGYEMVPYTINYIQDGRDYGSTWERNLRNAPYIFRFKYSTETPVDTYEGGFGAWVATFQYGNVAGDDVNGSGYGLVFTVKNFYFTFTYLDESVEQSLDDIQGAITSTDVDDEGGGDALEDVKDKIDIQVPDSLPVDDQFNALNSFIGIAADEVVDLFGAVVQPIYITIAGHRFDLMQLFLGFLGFFLLFGLVFLVLKGSHNTGGKDD